MTTIPEIISKLEAAKEGSAELDCQIFVAIGGTPLPDGTLQGWEWTGTVLRRPNKKDSVFTHDWDEWEPRYAPIPYYTTSLDAALTLVPKEPKNEPSGIWDWQVESTNGGLTISARVGNYDMCFADTAPLALCIAALKARLTQKDSK